MKTIKERAVAIAARCKSESYSSMVGTEALQLVREIANAPEPEPVAHAILLPNGATRIWFSDRDSGELWRARERVEQELTPLYTAPPAKNQSEQHLERVNLPALSGPDEFYNAVANLSVELEELVAETSGVYGLHLNGAPSPWEEILEGGHFERISSLHVVQNLLATRQPKQPEQPEQPADLVRDAAPECDLESARDAWRDLEPFIGKDVPESEVVLLSDVKKMLAAIAAEKGGEA